MEQTTNNPQPQKRGIIVATKEFFEKWLACHKAEGDNDPESHYNVTKLYENNTNTK